MSIESITAASAGTTLTSPVVGGGVFSGTAKALDPNANTMDKKAFLQLLVTQLRNQDPSSPMDSNALMAQTTQMASMEALTELSTTSRESFALQMRVAAAALVGKNVSYSDGTTTVTVGGKDVALDAIATISAAAPAPLTPVVPT